MKCNSRISSIKIVTSGVCRLSDLGLLLYCVLFLLHASLSILVSMVLKLVMVLLLIMLYFLISDWNKQYHHQLIIINVELLTLFSYII